MITTVTVWALGSTPVEISESMLLGIVDYCTSKNSKTISMKYTADSYVVTRQWENSADVDGYFALLDTFATKYNASPISKTIV